MCQTIAPLLIQVKGTIVQIGSVAGEIPYVFGSAYNASKAALHACSDTLHIDLEPLNANVMVVMTGGVKSNIARTYRELLEGSLYKSLDVGYQKRQLHSQEAAMEAKAYAKGVVEAALKANPIRTLWRGHHAWTVWLLLTLISRMFWDYYFIKVFNVTRFANLVKARKKTL